ncbi:MAG: hypothetical protein ACPL3C_01960 [Pyrobaculum sp.]|jgi:hypothetical protein
MYLFKNYHQRVDRVPLSEVVARVGRGENLEVVGYEGDAAVVDKVKGVVKGDFSSEDLGELKKRKPRGRPTKQQLELAAVVAQRLVEARKPFKVIFGPKEVTIRSGGGFIRVSEDSVKLAGYKSLDDDPIPLVLDVLKKYGEVKLLKPLK